MNNTSYETNIKAGFLSLGIIVVLLIVLRGCDASMWNDGYCECGGKWEYQQAIGHEYTTSYQYRCNKCGRYKEFDAMRGE